MIYEKEAVIHDEGGIHARVAAMIVQRSQELSKRYDCHLFLRSERSERCEMHSLMKLIALKVHRGDSVFVSSEGDNGRQAVLEMVRFLESDFEMHEAAEIHGVDKLLHENALIQERLQLILETVQDGICVVDRTGEITYVNPSYLRIVHKTLEMVIGQNVFETAPNGNRSGVLRSGVARIGSISHKKDGTTVVANVNPIFVDGEIAGVVSVIKDITEIQTLMERLSQVSAKAEYLEQELLRTKKTAQAFTNYIGKSGKVIDVLALASKAADSGANVLVRGESGTGKEVIAEGIHYASARRRGPFIRVNCGAIPGALLESELFGHEKGAFTGAVRRKLGKFELADHGTIFLDEIGDLDKNMQVKLLRVIQQKEFDRVGGEETIHVDVRIIAATNRDLEEMVKTGEFRDDLYYRLNVIPILLPPLRDRVEDIPLLVEHFIEKISSEAKKPVRGITPEAMRMLMHYRWPGNVRELENVIERVITLMDTEEINEAILPSYIKGEIAGREVQNIADDTILPWEEYEKQIIANALRQCNSFNAAGKLLRISHKTVAAKARKYGLV
ncbi:sigma 54-interacting transcriptional regulator [Mitsuokella sp.]|uniref:sigma 54-interacting transcriptional regulator n=1 Tax=Mitsuokella TaxID=52225 RepID=UPI0029E783AF|nr:sigma 54-interacting transcriptional regulator [Mitsuokella sp.]MDD6382997.1 sigma 54-interacting transcriptional regulator [Selenomonadaceae bacterium]MDY4475120.1 sigma 54-interacting transcriptional regulator [Mitsuokella sp.]